MSQNELLAIADFIISTVKGLKGPILGAQLGGLIKHQFGHVNLRDLGKLKPFIQQHCASEVFFLGKKGLDDLWGCAASELTSPQILSQKGILEVAGSSPEKHNTRGQSQQSGGNLSRTLSAWKAFTNPAVPEKLLFNPNDSDIDVVSGDHPVVLPFLQIAKVTDAEHRQIAKEFLEGIEDIDKTRFEAISNLQSFWGPWYQEIQNFKSGTYSTRWVRFRFQKLCDIFVDRLKNYGATSEGITACVAKLKYLKSESQKVNRSMARSNAASAKSKSDFDLSPDNTRINLRQVALVVVKGMGEEDLKRLWLPFGAVIDALKHN